MNSWRARFSAWLLMTLVMIGHAAMTAPLPNSPEAMLAYHGSAALLDWMLLILAPRLLSGWLCEGAQWLLLASICGNFAGWGLYMGYAAPTYYNAFMWGLTGVQWLLLLLPDSHADNPWHDLVSRRAGIGGGDPT